ncbi:DegT/DnrJ/EryC1/StrS family aminotransferase [Sphingomonas tabacisoli]|uniref:DegT/DnrJ/EryC1/StrS family aminotransferase n=1 Tax=Sphingomonas tabacisoli TaxID=2249466 RepID=A0ABW4I3T7_9SPHN
MAYNTMGPAEAAAIAEVVASGRMTQGERVTAFEAAIAARHGVKHAILVNSGSSANLIAIEAAFHLAQLRPDLLPQPIQRGDEAIIQGLNWPSTLTPILNRGLRPVFCDIDLSSLNASVEHVDAVRTDRTRMVVAVPVLGNPSHLEELRDYCQANKLVLIEDACESIGAVTERGNAVGTLGLAASFSFYFSHHITTIEGGAVITDDPHIADLCYALRAHGWSRGLQLESFLAFDKTAIDERFCFVIPGYNVRSTDLNAAIGLVQLERLDGMLEARRRIAKGRAAALADTNRVAVPGIDILDRHSWMTTPLLFSDRAHRDRAKQSLEASGVETRPIIVGNMLRHPLARLLDLPAHQPDLPNCDEVFDRGLMIGLSPIANEEDEAVVQEALISAAKA